MLPRLAREATTRDEAKAAFAATWRAWLAVRQVLHTSCYGRRRCRIHRMSDSDHWFGGDWIEIKLDAVRAFFSSGSYCLRSGCGSH
jgi:hypothetical protein